MLLVWLVVLSASQAQPGPAVGTRELAPQVKQCANGARVRVADSCPPNLPDHRTQFTINPLEVTNTREWKCAKDGSSARWTVTTRDVSAPNRNETFASELVELVLNGRAANVELQARVKAALTDFNTVPILKVECLGRFPVILLTGSRRVRNEFHPLRVEITLR